MPEYWNRRQTKLGKHRHLPEDVLTEEGEDIPVTVRQRIVTLTDAQIKALPTTYVELVPPTEVLDYDGTPTEVIMPLACYIQFNTETAYENLSDDPRPTILVAIGSDWSMSVMQFLLVAEGFSPDDATSAFLEGGRFTMLQFAGTDIGTNGASHLTDGLKDNGLYLIATNGEEGDFTAGGAGNSWSVTVLYVVLGTAM